MALPAGVRIGPYEVRGLLGAGGMGEVYLAWDARIGREVAVKMLPASGVPDAGRLRRFEQEARTAGALNHPNVLAVYDVGSHEGAPYIVSERLEGETLRDRIAGGGLTPRKAIEHAVQIARGLAAAHASGIVHRDLKPENVFVCRDGTVKILDFGLAKLIEDAVCGACDTTLSRMTRPGALLGTPAYMSPEQINGLPVDARSDIFSLGIVLYEMLARRRPFEGATPAEVQAGILREEPRELPAVDNRLSATLDRIVRRCLEKRAEDRFDTARDVALSLEAVTVASGEVPATVAQARHGSRRRGAALVAAGLIAGTALGALLLGYLRPAPRPPSYTQLTFRRGKIGSARFAPDGQTVVYAAAWDGEPSRLFAMRLGSRESRDLGIEGGLLGISSNGEMAVRLGARDDFAPEGTLARVSLSGGAPRELLDGVVDAAWDAAGRDLAVVHRVNGRTRLEYPIGHVVYESTGEIQAVCVVPGGSLGVIELLPDGGASPFAISIIDPTRGRRVVSAGWAELWRLVWSPPSGEIFFSGDTGAEFALHAVSPAGAARLVARVPGDFQLKDVDSRGRILLARSFPRGGVAVLRPGTAQERDLSWLDFSYVADISADGRQLLLGDIGGGLVGKGGIVVRKTDGSPAVPLGEGSALSLSPDGRFVLALPDALGSGDRLLVLATGVGDRRELRHPSIPRIINAAWFPDGRHIAVVGGAGPDRMRLQVWDVDGQAAPRPLSLEGEFGQPVVAPDGRFVTVAQKGKPPALYAVDGGPPRALPGGRDDDEPLRWAADGRSLFVRRGIGLPARIDRVEIATGRRQVWKELRPADPAGVFNITGVVVTPDGAGYAYTFSSSIGSLYLAEGIR